MSRAAKRASASKRKEVTAEDIGAAGGIRGGGEPAVIITPLLQAIGLRGGELLPEGSNLADAACWRLGG
jgi:hypothetical protein